MQSIVTGADGFIGKKLVAKLENSGYDVIPLKKEDGDLSLVNIKEIVSKDRKVNTLFHLASKTFVPLSWNSPEDFINSNVASTLNILRFCRENNTALIYLSAYIYGNQTSFPINENAKINPSNPYAHSKYLSEELCRFFSRVFDMDITILRPFNVYGPDQKKYFLIPEIIEQLKSGNKIKVNSFKPRRDYIYVDDLLTAIIMASKKTSSLQIYNVGSGKSISVYELIQLMGEILGRDLDCQEVNIERNKEINNVIADISSAKRYLKWTPETNLKEGLAKTLSKEGLY